ncbi:MAG TPA: glycosyltransferase [Acidocella sp.]|jgi:GT2 family glycosyltransferase|nr:glycosyltransferase [Acidocella sp.]
MQGLKIRFVVATRESRDNFFVNTATGMSLDVYKSFPFLQLDLYASNTEGLSTVYNRSIERAKNDPAILIFAHDDLHFTDFYWADRLVNSLNHFEILGVAGNKRRVPNQPSWAFIDSNLTWDSAENLSGVVGHGTGFPLQNLSVYGPTYQEVKLLDGLLLACRSESLHQKELKFDERFDFHFYDMDFCRQAELKNMRMGTWSLSVVHNSSGVFGSRSWHEAKAKYFEKWGN